MKHNGLKNLKNYRVVLIFLLISVVLLLPILFQNGVPFKYDWGWPFFEMGQFWVDLIEGGSFGLFTSLSRYGPAIFGLFELIHFPPPVFLKIFLISIHFTAGYGFYRFIRPRIESETVAIISGLAYAFSPYIFIRTIVGFVWSMVAYAVLPLFLSKYFQPNKKILDYLLTGFLFSLVFSQSQAGLLISLVMFVNLMVIFIGTYRKATTCRHSRLDPRLRGDESRSLVAESNRLDPRFHGDDKGGDRDDKQCQRLCRRDSLKNYLLTNLSLLLVALPWAVVIYFNKLALSVASGGAVTTLNFIASLPHSFRNMLMLSDHHITWYFFYALAHDKLFIIGWLVVWLTALCAILNKKNRELVFTFMISSLIVLPFIKGPLGVFGKFYLWFYNHFPQIAIFRETYHFEYLYAISLCVLFAIGLDWVWEKADTLKLKVESEKLKVILKTGLKTLLAGSAIFIIAPYLTFDYAGYLKLQKIPAEYFELHNYLRSDSGLCQKIYYPPGLGFVYFRDDRSAGASNSDVMAISLDLPYLNDGTSVLNAPSEESFYRNELVSEFYEKSDSGQFATLLQEGNIDCVILRLETDTKYHFASNLWREKDPTIVKKWNNIHLKDLIETKKGLVETKRFGENIWIYKINPPTNLRIERNYEITNKTGEPAIQQFDNLAIKQLPLTSWANNFAYYKDGWSRGRYDFWRKHLFTQLRQDFIYTDKQDSVLTAKIDQNGFYELWARYLTGGTPGEISLRLKTYDLRLVKDPGEEKFVWKKLGEIELNGNANIEIKNISGENAIADIVLVEK